MEDPIDQLANSISKKCGALPPLSSKCCIYKVPRNLRMISPKSYTPHLVSIGPFHRGDPNLLSMEEQKLRCLHRFIRRNEKKNLEDYLSALMKWEKEARDCYSETISLTSEDFIEMLLFDGCFVIEFLMTWRAKNVDLNDRVFHRPALSQAVLRDLKLLENQVPFFILEVLYNLAFDGLLPSFLNLTCECLVEVGKVPKKFKKTKTLHLVDFLRTYYLPPERNGPIHEDSDSGSNHGDLDSGLDLDSDWEFPDGISKLHETGIKLKVEKDEKFLDIKFENGILQIPELMLENHTESELRNLVAFEQCHYPRETFVVDYLLFLDSLIFDRKDVDILMSNGIVLNSPGSSEDVYDLFSSISKETTYSTRGFYYADICRRLNKHCRDPWNKWKAILRQDYFSNPWSIISTVAAIVLLILTVIQTYCDIVSLRY